MQRLRRLISCSTAALVLFASGCDRDASPPPILDAAEMHAPEPAATEPAAADALAIAKESAAAQPPTPLAADLPLYGQALPISSMSSPQRTVVNLRSDDAPDRVAAWYGTELPARGWELEKQSGAATTFLVTAHKDVRKTSVLITGGEQGTQILITVLEDR